MPEIGADVHAVLKMYERCKTWKCLPFEGSLMEQPAWAMDLLDVVSSEVAAQKAKAAEREAADVKKQEMERTLG